MFFSGESFMTSRWAQSGGNADLNSVRRQAGAGRFMVTLRTLDAPVSIRQPQSPHLKPFTFFVSRAYQKDGTERFHLNMGYFNTLADAEKWAETTRRQFPCAFATIAAGTPPWPANSEVPASPQGGSHEPGTVGSLTDTQVLKILETRRDPAVREGVDEGRCDQIELLRPDDTITRQVLREAIAENAPVWFAVQLHWSAQPIDLSAVRPLPVFRAHTLYAAATWRNGRSRHFLRLGFFTDPISAKQVAVQVRSTFDAAAVIPVIEPEITRARAASAADAIPYLDESRVDPQGDFGSTSSSSLRSAPPVSRSRRARASAAAANRTDAAPGEPQIWTEPDLLNDSGVRHLRVERQEHLSGRWKIIRLRDDSPAETQFPA
jgi:hypothetical protein